MRPRTPQEADVRLRGFAELATLARAQDWVDRHATPLAAEELGVEAAVGRVLAEVILAPSDRPSVARAGIDGYAVRAAETVGASAYDPIPLRLQDPSARLGAAAAALISAGAPLPPGADAVLGFDAAQPSADAVEVVGALAPGAGVDGAGQEVRAGATLLAAGRVLDARDAAVLAALGPARVRVVGRPRVQLVLAGPKEAGARDAHGAMLRALIERDGGALEPPAAGADVRTALARAAPGHPHLLIVTGRSGTGPDDVAAPALAEAGEVALHGLALRPGGSAGMGHVGGTPALLLPGDPLACLVAYELLAGRFVRRLGGRSPELPHRTCDGELRRKLVSAVGLVEVRQVRLADGQVEPLGVAEFGGLAAAGRADGFVIVPAPLEGYAPGARVSVHLY